MYLWLVLIWKTEIYRVRTVLLDARWKGVHVAARGVHGCLPSRIFADKKLQSVYTYFSFDLAQGLRASLC